MKTILLKRELKQTFIFGLLLFFISITNSFAQDTFDGKYCPGPGASGDEYATGKVISQVLRQSPSSTCQIGTIHAKVDTQNQILRLGMNIGNGGAALFRLYLDTDNNPSTGLTSDNFGGTLTIPGADYILEINSNASTFKLYSGSGSTKTELTVNNGLAALNGSATGCNSGGGSFLEFNIPFGSIGFNICNTNSPGTINISKLASVSGNSENSSLCENISLTFGIPLKGSVSPDATVCSGTNSTILTATVPSGSTIVKWQSSISPFTTWTDITNTSTTYTATNLTETKLFRAVFSNAGLCSGSNIATSEAKITVTAPPSISTTKNNVSCYNGNNGQATALVSGGTAPYTYTWNTTPVITSATATGLTAGNYTVTVRDSKGCSNSIQVTISQPNAALTASITSQTNVDCYGNNSGSVTVAGANGTAPYTYAINGGAFGESGTFASLVAGDYTVTVKDANGCTKDQAVTISEPENALSATASNQVNVSCKGGNDGSVVITPAGGTAGYTITPDQTGLTAGLHTFTVTDSKGCKTTIDVTISEPANPLALAASSKTDASCNGSSTGSVTAGTVTNAVGTVT